MNTEDCCSPDFVLDALDQLVANDCVTCTACGYPLHYWPQESNRGIRNADGKLIGLEAYTLTMCHCVNPDCELNECTTSPANYHQHMALFLEAHHA